MNTAAVVWGVPKRMRLVDQYVESREVKILRLGRTSGALKALLLSKVGPSMGGTRKGKDLQFTG